MPFFFSRGALVPPESCARRAEYNREMTISDNQLIEWAGQREATLAKVAAQEASLRERILKEIIGGLWHTTSPDRFQRILSTGAILPEPSIPDSERWGTSEGAKNHPYVRTLGGVSLFDFHQFDPNAYQKEYPLSSWAHFVPYQSTWGQAVWIELNRDLVTPPQFVSGSELLARWIADKAHGHKIMPEIEAAYLGAFPTTAFKRAFSVSKESDQLHELAL